MTIIRNIDVPMLGETMGPVPPAPDSERYQAMKSVLSSERVEKVVERGDQLLQGAIQELEDQQLGMLGGPRVSDFIDFLREHYHKAPDTLSGMAVKLKTKLDEVGKDKQRAGQQVAAMRLKENIDRAIGLEKAA